MTKLTKTERETFEAIGAAICGSKDAAKTKKAKMPLVADFIAKNHDALEAGLVIGNYKFTLITREELTAIRIDEPKEGN